MSLKLDKIDRRILNALQDDGRIQNIELAKLVGLSRRRVYGGCGRSKSRAGDCDFLLRVLTSDLDTYRRFQIEHLGRIESVKSIKTEIPMQKIKQSSKLPL